MFGFGEKRRLKKRLSELGKSAASILHREDEILTPKAKESLKAVVDEAARVPLERKAVDAFASGASSRIEAAFPRSGFGASLRDWLDIIAVALAVAFGIRAIYLQPFKIPTSSMQPTLFGIHYVDRNVFPNLGAPLDYALFTTRSVQIESLDSGRPYYVGSSNGPLGMFPSISFGIGNIHYTVPGTAKELMAYFGDRIDRTVEKGERVCDGWLSLGDHLFVNRVGIYLLGPARGDVTVFCTEGIEYKPQPLGGYYYIKRLAGMPGDTLKIEKGVLLVKPKGAKEFKPVYEICEKFKKVYSMKGGYQGHSIPAVPEEYRAYMTLSKEGQEVVVPDDCYFMLGDNTTSSLDSRYWGFVPRRNLVGTAGFVFWPFSRRWGLADFRAPIDEPTALPHSMCLQ